MYAGNPNEAFESVQPEPIQIGPVVMQTLDMVDQYYSSEMRRTFGGISLASLMRAEAEELIARRDAVELESQPSRMD